MKNRVNSQNIHKSCVSILKWQLGPCCNEARLNSIPVNERAIDLRRDSSLVCHSERNSESRKPDKRFGVSLGMTEERLSALSRFKWVANERRVE